VKATLSGRAAALLAASALVVAGCGAHPGAAADLDGYQIPMETVDDQAAALCAVGPVLVLGAMEGQQADGRAFRVRVVSSLVRLRMAELAADELGLDVPVREVTADDLASPSLNVPTENLSGSEIDHVVAYINDNLRISTLLDAVHQELTGQPRAQNEPLSQETLDLLEQQVDDVEIDPRLGLDEQLEETLASGSFSVPVSDGAQAPPAGDGAEPPTPAEEAQRQTFLSGLPAEQRCG
jgi:hypothetical protein